MGAPVFGAYMLMIDISSWLAVPFINMKWPSLSLLNDLSLRSTLSDMGMANPACLWGPFAWKTFFHPLTRNQCLFFSVRWVSCKQHIVGSCFLTQFAILCPLIGALMPFTFSVNIERCFLFPVILVSLLFSFTYSLFICLLAQKGLFFLESFCLTLVYSSICKSPLSIFCGAGLVITNCFIFSLLWKVIISPSIRKDSFAGYSSLGWQLLSFRAWILSFYDLVAFIVWVEKSVIFFFLCAQCFDYDLFGEVFLFWSCWFGVL
jgi:hypothetical protein